jgi:hypothetical protein
MSRAIFTSFAMKPSAMPVPYLRVSTWDSTFFSIG